MERSAAQAAGHGLGLTWELSFGNQEAWQALLRGLLFHPVVRGALWLVRLQNMS